MSSRSVEGIGCRAKLALNCPLCEQLNWEADFYSPALKCLTLLGAPGPAHGRRLLPQRDADAAACGLSRKMQPQRLWCSQPESICQRVQMANNPLDRMGNPWFQSDRGGDLTGAQTLHLQSEEEGLERESNTRVPSDFCEWHYIRQI